MTIRSLRFSKYALAATMLVAFVSPAPAEEAEEQPTNKETTIPAPQSEEAKERKADLRKSILITSAIDPLLLIHAL